MRLLAWFLGTYAVLIGALMLVMHLLGANAGQFLPFIALLAVFPALMIAADQTKRPPSNHL
jgi:hypothetical protein